MFKHKTITLSVLLSLFFFMGCGDDDNPVDISSKLDRALIGQWKMYQTVAAGTATSLPEGSQIILTLNGDGTYNDNGENGQWYTSFNSNTNSNYLTRDPEGLNPEFSIKYTLGNNDLVLNTGLIRTYYSKIITSK